MARLLLLETATENCSIAISDGDRILALQEATEDYRHAAEITLLIEACCREAGLAMTDLEAVAVSAGPGSYTALRVGSSVAKGICYALDLPMIAVDTLASLARASQHPTDPANALYVPMIDARRMEVYTAVYDGTGQPLEALAALIIDEGSFAQQFAEGHTLIFSGNGAPKCKSVLTHPNAVFRSVFCTAPHLNSVAQTAFLAADFVDIAYFSPTYFKSPNITTPRKIL